MPDLTPVEAIRLARRAHTEGDLDAAFRLLAEVARAPGSQAHALELVECLKTIGHTQRERGFLEDARVSYETAADLLDSREYPSLLAHTRRHVGDILAELGLLAEARRWCDEALEMYRAMKAAPPLELANALRSCALLRGTTDEARSLWREAQSLYASLGVSAGVEECRSHLTGSGQA